MSCISHSKTLKISREPESLCSNPYASELAGGKNPNAEIASQPAKAHYTYQDNSESQSGSVLENKLARNKPVI